MNSCCASSTLPEISSPNSTIHPASGTVTTWTTASFAYDGLNRLVSKTDRDGATQPMALTRWATSPIAPCRAVLQWRATYNNAGQMLKDWNASGSSGTRTNHLRLFCQWQSLCWFAANQDRWTQHDHAYSYDDWLRATNMACTGTLPEQNLTTTWQYEPRGFVTSIAEQFASTNTGTATSVQRSFDPYGQLASEYVSAGSFAYGSSQSWNAAGRRTGLGIGSASYGFGWQADGNLTFASNPTGNGSYSYDTSGLLTSRLVANRMTSIASRDGEGRPLVHHHHGQHHVAIGRIAHLVG